MTIRRSHLAGCGCSAAFAVILVVALVGWIMSFSGGPSPVRHLNPVPVDVPPAAGEPVPPINTDAPGRTADQLYDWAAPLAGDTSIPAAALRAYGNATVIASKAWPECHLQWTTLAGIGWVETRHGTYNGKLFGRSTIGPEGVVTPAIVGVPLDGSPGFAEIRDTDGGVFDGDTTFDRAVGPMQFIPSSWKIFGRDANGDGKADPSQIDDAALAAAVLLCAHGRDLSTPQGWTDAVGAYNRSDEYMRLVRDAAAAYAIRQPAV